MTALGLVLFTAVVMAWIFPRRLGEWLAHVRHGYEAAARALQGSAKQ